MKTYTTIAAITLSLFAAGAAQAQEAVYELPAPATSSLTRAEVVADLLQARAAGFQQVAEGNYPAQAPRGQSRTRAEVRAETLAAIASGELHALNSEIGETTNEGYQHGHSMMAGRMTHNMK